MSGVAVDIKLFHESGFWFVHKYRIYDDPLPHQALWDGVVKKLLGFVHWTMAIAQLTHLHLTIPWSGSSPEPVPPECFPVVPLSRKSAVSRQVSFARDVAVIESSPLLFSPVEESESLTAPTERDMRPLERSLIQIVQPAYVLFPSEEPFDDSDGVSTLRLSGRAIIWGRLMVPPAPPGYDQDVLGLLLTFSPIARVPSGASVEHMSSSSSVGLDNSDGDAV